MEPTEEPDIPPVQCKGEKRDVPHSNFPWLDEGATSCLAGEPCWVEPSNSWQVEVATPQLECGGRKGAASMSQRTQKGCAGGVWTDIVAGVPQAQTRGSATSRLQESCSLSDEDSPSLAPIEAPQKQDSQMH